MIPRYCEGCKKIVDGKCGWYADPFQATRTVGDVTVRGCINSPISPFQQSILEAQEQKKRVGQQKGRRGKKRR